MDNTADMIAMYNSGMSYEHIAISIGKSKKWVMVRLHGKITPRPPKRHKIQVDTIPWSEKHERDRLAIELYRKGDGATLVARQLGITKKTVYSILRAYGQEIDKDRTANKISQHKQEINESYDAGYTMAELASKYNVSEATIRNHITNPRDDADALSTIPPDLQEKVLELYKDGWSTYKIADEYGWSYQCVQNFIKRKGLSVGAFTPEWKAAVQRGIKETGSRLEKQVEQLLQSLDIPYDTQAVLGDFRYDFGLPNDVLLEVQGSYWHSKKQRIQRDSYKRKLAAEHGKKLLVVWDHELAIGSLAKYRILNAIRPVEFDFKSCNVTQVSWKDARDLLASYHYQGTGRSGQCIGVTHNGTVVAVAVFCYPTRQETASKQGLAYNEVLELSRLVIHPSYQARNLATWFLSRAIKIVRNSRPDIKLLIAFADPTFGHSGAVYRAANWELDGYANASYWYYHRRQNRIYHKKTIWNAARDAGISEDELARSRHLIKVHGQRKIRYKLVIR